jgi:hypothetical protein
LSLAKNIKDLVITLTFVNQFIPNNLSIISDKKTFPDCDATANTLIFSLSDPITCIPHGDPAA